MKLEVVIETGKALGINNSNEYYVVADGLVLDIRASSVGSAMLGFFSKFDDIGTLKYLREKYNKRLTATSGPKVRCKKCDDVIQSMHRHDFRWCKCGAIAIDGGSD